MPAPTRARRAAAFGIGALRAAMDWRADRVARAEARAEAEAREQAHADALTCDAIHEAGRVAGHRAGYDVGHRRAWDECYPHAWQLGCSAGEARMRRANARAQLGLPAPPAPRVCQLCCVRCVEPESHHALCSECQLREKPWTFDPRTRIGRQLNGEG